MLRWEYGKERDRPSCMDVGNWARFIHRDVSAHRRRDVRSLQMITENIYCSYNRWLSLQRSPVCIGVASGCSGCTCTAQGGEKKFLRPNFQEKCVSGPPQDTKCTPATARVNFRTVFAEWLRFGGIFRQCLWGRRLKKGRQLFWQKKVHPETKSWLRLCLYARRCSSLYGWA